MGRRKGNYIHTYGMRKEMTKAREKQRKGAGGRKGGGILPLKYQLMF